MKSVRSFELLAVIVACVGLIAGCQPQATDRAATYQVAGTVTLNGEALDGATVTFVPNGPGNSASGITDASGKYTLSTFGGGDGATPGEYSVKIAKYEGAAAAATGRAASGDSQYPDDYKGEEADAEQGSKNLLPEKYANPATSGFTAKVEASDSNVFDFALEGSAAPAK